MTTLTNQQIRLKPDAEARCEEFCCELAADLADAGVTVEQVPDHTYDVREGYLVVRIVLPCGTAELCFPPDEWEFVTPEMAAAIYN